MLPQNVVPEDLKNLLAKWNLECILSHLVGEKIDIKVLEMMKLPHIRLLLQYFPLGIQIRFEYYLEQWREEIGKPFQTFVSDNRSLLISKENECKNKRPAKEMETKATQTDLIIYNISSIPSNTNESVTHDTSGSNSCAEGQENLKLAPEQLSSTLKSPRSPQSQKVDLLTILKNAPCGISLINSYGLRQSFTNLERKLLIESIVDYFIKNNIQCNVQISHVLEQDILKMFPSENLNSYRIDKCGKIFISYIKAKAKARAESKAADAKLEAANAKAEEKAEAITAAEPKVLKVGNAVYEISSNMVVDEDFEALYQLSDNHIVIQTENPTNSAMTDISQIDSMSDNTEPMIFTLDAIDNEETKTAAKINSDEVDITATLDSETLIRKMLSQKRQRIEEIDRPFIDFTIPWEKVPSEIIYSLQMEQPLGKRLNLFANLIVDELRKIAKHVPMRVLRAVNQQAVMKYPHSFLDKDSKGNLKTSTSTALLSRLRNRHTFLNRHDR